MNQAPDADAPRSDASVDKIVVILNASHMFMLVMTGLFFAALFTDYGTDGTMLSVVALTMVIFCDLAFTIIAISLSVAKRSVDVTSQNLMAVWLTIPALTIPPFPDLYADLIGFFPSDAQIASTALALCFFLFAWIMKETIPLWKRANVQPSL